MLLTLFLSVVIKQRGHRERDARFLESYFAFKVLLVLLLNCTNRLFDLVFSFKLYKQAIFVTIRSWVLVNILVIFCLLLTNLSVSRLLNNAGIEKKTRGFLEKKNKHLTTNYLTKIRRKMSRNKFKTVQTPLKTISFWWRVKVVRVTDIDNNILLFDNLWDIVINLIFVSRYQTTRSSRKRREVLGILLRF